MRLVLVVCGVLLLAPAAGSALPPPPAKKAAVSKARRAAKARRRRVKRRRRRAAKRCRDIFCTAQVVRLDGRGGNKRALTQPQVEKVMTTNHGKLERCLVDARRRNPDLLRATIEFVVHSSGRVLASRVNGKRRNTLARCIHKQMRKIRFPRSGMTKTVASFNLAVPQ
jgi:hypothetical protein